MHRESAEITEFPALPEFLRHLGRLVMFPVILTVACYELLQCTVGYTVQYTTAYYYSIR